MDCKIKAGAFAILATTTVGIMCADQASARSFRGGGGFHRSSGHHVRAPRMVHRQPRLTRPARTVQLRAPYRTSVRVPTGRHAAASLAQVQRVKWHQIRQNQAALRAAVTGHPPMFAQVGPMQPQVGHRPTDPANSLPPIVQQGSLSVALPARVKIPQVSIGGWDVPQVSSTARATNLGSAFDKSARQAQELAEARSKPQTGGPYFNRMDMPQAQPDPDKQSKENREKLIAILTSLLGLDNAAGPQTLLDQYAQAGARNVDPNAPQSDAGQGRSRADKLAAAIEKIITERNPGADPNRIKDIAKKAADDPELNALVDSRIEKRTPGQSKLSAVDQAFTDWKINQRADAANKKAEAAARAAAEAEAKRQQAENGAKLERQRVNYPIYLKKWKDHREQRLPDGTTGLASEYNAKLIEGYNKQRLEVHVGPERKLRQDRSRQSPISEPSYRGAVRASE